MLKVKNKTFFLLFLLSCHLLYGQTDAAPQITAEGRQSFCIGSPINIVTDFSITDLDDTGIVSFFIQISTGYQVGFDRLDLSGSHPNIISLWDVNDAKLTLISSVSGGEILFSDLENAVKDIIFTTSAADNIMPEKKFSLTTNNTNYLPLTDHFYEFVPDLNITWTNAKIAAESRVFFGRQGYLATLTSVEEANFAGKQASGTGWIGGSDKETEGVWKWVTGPEVGTVFWNGQVNGTTPNFAFWNNNEPNDFRGNNPNGEHYAHITDPSIGISGAWNDLPNEGGTGLYIAKGYIVEYGSPGDPQLSIVANTSIYLPQILNITEAIICESGITTISATPSEGEILWYDTQTGGTLLATGNDFITPNLSVPTTYFATVSLSGCNTLGRTAVNVTVNQRPTITSVTEDLVCSGPATLGATASTGAIYWYDSLTDTTPIFIGNSFVTSDLSATRSYFVEANNSNCISSVRTEITAVLDVTIPEFELEKNEYSLCADIGSVTLSTINPQGTYRYVWLKDGLPFTGNSATNLATSSGVYNVKAISLAGCESVEKEIKVINSSSAIITNEDVLIVDNSDNNSIEIINSNLGDGDYEFVIDNINGVYQKTTLFENLSVRPHTLYIRDKNGCGITAYKFSILNYPKFFTPNNDGFNDFWNVKGLDNTLFTKINVFIYNRYGSLIYKLDANTSGWDGTFNGKLLPSSSYWFSIQLLDINGSLIENYGNFSLLR